MIRDEFLEKMYFNKVKNEFSEQIDVRVFKKTNSDANHNLSISLKRADGSFIYEYVLKANSLESVNSLIDSLREYLIIGDEGNRIFRDQQFKSKAFHMSGKVPEFGINELFGFISSIS